MHGARYDEDDATRQLMAIYPFLIIGFSVQTELNKSVNLSQSPQSMNSSSSITSNLIKSNNILSQYFKSVDAVYIELLYN